MESSSKRDGITKVNSSEVIDTYNDTNRLTMNKTPERRREGYEKNA